MVGGIGDIVRRHGVLAWLTGINAVIFFMLAIFMLFAKVGNMNSNPAVWLELPALTQLWISRPWTLLTYMFTHENFLHLLFNMLWLLWFGELLLRQWSTRRLLILYLGGGIVGGLLYMTGLHAIPALYAGGFPILLGASASVLAIMTATATLMPRHTIHLFFIGDVKLKWVAIVMIILAFLGLGGGNAGGEIAHIGGVIFGFTAAKVWINYTIDTTTRPKQPHRKNPFKGLSPHPELRQSQPATHNPVEREKYEALRLDQLLDKIHTSGFNSLTKKERAELEELSRKVTK